MKKYKIKDIKIKDFNKIKIGIKKDENDKVNDNKDIWQDYLDIGEYANAINCCKNDNKLVRRINRINAEELFNRGDYLNSAMIYNNSDENFEIICLKYLMKDQIDALNYFLELYLSTNYSIKKEKGKEKEKEKKRKEVLFFSYS